MGEHGDLFFLFFRSFCLFFDEQFVFFFTWFSPLPFSLFGGLGLGKRSEDDPVRMIVVIIFFSFLFSRSIKKIDRPVRIDFSIYLSSLFLVTFSSFFSTHFFLPLMECGRAEDYNKNP